MLVDVDPQSRHQVKVYALSSLNSANPMQKWQKSQNFTLDQISQNHKYRSYGKMGKVEKIHISSDITKSPISVLCNNDKIILISHQDKFAKSLVTVLWKNVERSKISQKSPIPVLWKNGEMRKIHVRSNIAKFHVRSNIAKFHVRSNIAKLPILVLSKCDKSSKFSHQVKCQYH